ncbi:MAG: type II secretion system protein GspN [Myxococcales bacterium]|nr:type II secretion system protein GspN [Myxococcales bacterium]
MSDLDGGRPLPSLDDVPVAGTSGGFNPGGPSPSASMSATPSRLTPEGVGFDLRGLGRVLLRGLGWFFGLLLVFIIAAWVSLPTDAISWRISHEARKAGFNISMDELSLRPWGSVKARGVTWNFTPSRPDSIPVPFVIEELDISFSVLSYLLFDEIDVEFEGVLDEGSITGAYVQGEDTGRIAFKIEDLPLYAVPKLQEAVNAPVRGIFALDVDIEASEGEWAKATGKLEIHCRSCTIGDGDTKLYVPGANPKSMVSKGVTIPEIDLGTLDGVLDVKDGKAVAEEFGSESDDLQLKVSGDITFKDPIGKSRLNLIIKIFITPELRKKSENIDLVVVSASDKVKMPPPDEGWFGYVLEGNFKNRKLRGINEKSKTEKQRETRERAQQRQRDREARRAQQAADRQRQQAEREAAQANSADEAAGEAAEGADGEAADDGGGADGGSDPIQRTIPPEAGIVREVETPEEGADEAGDAGQGSQGEEEGGQGEEEGGQGEEGQGEGEGDGAQAELVQ